VIARTSVPTVLLTVLLTGCAAGSDGAPPAAAGSAPAGPASSADPSPSGAPSASVAPPASPSPSVAPSPAVRTIDVSYAGGQVSGTTGREQVAVGEHVVLRITSDVADEVHVHGYDLQQALPAGVPVEIPLHATIPGGFEVELHDAGRPLFQLRVA
jgi:hypothetical protein